MKKHHLIFGSTAIFTFLFYDEGVGVNVSLFAFALLCLIYANFKNRDKIFNVLAFCSLCSIMAFAWYGDLSSFFALFFSLLFLQFKNNDKRIKVIQSIPVVFVNFFTSLARPFFFGEWLPKIEIGNNSAKKLIAYILIPSIFLILFFTVYSFASDAFSGLLRYELDLDYIDVFLIIILGFYISFTFWNLWFPNYVYTLNHKLDNDFSQDSQSNVSPSFSFLDIEFERKSGEISLIVLIAMLVIFIVSYNYEQFFKVQNIAELSAATHDRVNTVILSILMAVGVITFYFKNGFNFDPKAKNLRLSAYIWISLNAILVVSSLIKNSEYILSFGLTYKRLGVYAFLILILVGLGYTFLKIKNKKTNAYLFNQMIWFLYGLLLVCACFNWGNLITNYNIKVNKGVEPVFLSKLSFNDGARRAYFLDKDLDGRYPEIAREEEIERNQKANILSTNLYFLTLDEIN